jgi:hypothetical protein
MGAYLTDEQVARFRKDGVLVLRDFYRDEDIQPIQRGIYDVIGNIMIKNGVPDSRASFTPDNFDQNYLALIKQNRAWGGEVYDAIKQIPAFVRLVAHPAHEALVSELRPGAQPGVAAGGYGIRIDNPNEDRFRAMWHQEYPAQLRSVDGLVFWSPLVSITEDLGPVIFCPGSQAEGPLPVSEADPEKAGRSGAYALQIHNEAEYLAKYDKIAPLTNPRDLVVLDFLVLHASGYNRGVRPRWTMQFRYFNFAEPIGRNHAWQGSYAAGVDFRKIHPELFVA